MRRSRPNVIVIGSGAAGSSAALAAQAQGASVTVLERAQLLGGTTSFGAVLWIPANHLMRRKGIPDDVETALGYISAACRNSDASEELWRAYAHHAAAVIEATEAESRIRWQIVDMPDYYTNLPGSCLSGRSIEPEIFEVSAEMAARVRTPPYYQYITYFERMNNLFPSDEEIELRKRGGVVFKGRGLVAGLLEAAERRGTRIRTGIRATELILDGDAVVGVRTEHEEFHGRVLLSTGGFERNATLVKTFLRGPLLAPGGNPCAVGDGLMMAMSANARLANMTEASWCPGIRIRDEVVEGEPYYWMSFHERAHPGVLVVNERGRRFADEATTYNDFTKSMHFYDPHSHRYPNAHAWQICDATAFRRWGVGPLRDGDQLDPQLIENAPPWMFVASSVADLAAKIGVEPASLVETVEGFNKNAREGVDWDFGRDEPANIGYYRDTSVSLKSLGTLTEPPFVAVELLPGALGTRGGPRMDPHGRILSASSGAPIEGLYGAGNVCASIFGDAYPGAGSTIGPATTFGWLAGVAAATD